MNYVIFVFALFTLAFLLTLFQIIKTISKKSIRGVAVYDIQSLFIFLALAIWKVPEISEIVLPDITDSVLFGIFAFLGIWAIFRLGQKLTIKSRFKAYRSDLFVVVFSILVLVSTFPF